MEEQYIEGDKVALFKNLGLIGSGILLLIYSDPIMDQLLSNKDVVGNTSCEKIRSSLDNLLVTIYISILFCGAFTVHFARLALKVKRAGRWPPPSMKVPFRTRIRYGAYVRDTWIMLLVTSVLFVVPPIFNIYSWETTEEMYSTLCSHNKTPQPTPKSGAADL